MTTYCIVGRGAGPGQIAARVYGSRSGDVADFMPTGWDPHLIIKHFLPCSEFYDHATHIVALEYHDDVEGFPVYFGGSRIDGAFVVIAFNEGKLVGLHCETCAVDIARVIHVNQGGWASVYKASVQ